jgi:hypothetical protein
MDQLNGIRLQSVSSLPRSRRTNSGSGRRPSENQVTNRTRRWRQGHGKVLRRRRVRHGRTHQADASGSDVPATGVPRTNPFTTIAVTVAPVTLKAFCQSVPPAMQKTPRIFDPDEPASRSDRRLPCRAHRGARQLWPNDRTLPAEGRAVPSRADIVAKVGGCRLRRNNRIAAGKFLNQHCV